MTYLIQFITKNLTNLLLSKFILILSLLVVNQQSYSKTQSQQVDELLKIWNSESQPGLVLAVNQGVNTVYKKSFGLADLENKRLINDHSVFLIASVSKQFTAFAINQLEANGQLSLTDNINKYLPELPQYEHVITITHLLNHTSGLRDVDDLNGLIGVGLSDYTSFNDIYNLIMKQTKLNFKPGEKFDYSNSGYVLLAKIVENVSELSFREYMNSKVFKPLNMNDTLVFDNPFEVIQNKATAYYSNDGIHQSRNNLFSANYGSTGIHTTINDLNKWAKNFVKPVIGNQAILKTMETQGVLNDGEVISYAMGQEIKQMHGHKAVFHGGGQGAYRAYMIRFPETELSITLLSNSSYSTQFLLQYIDAVSEIYLPKKSAVVELSKKQKTDVATVPVATFEFNASDLEKFVGSYQIQEGLYFSIEKNDAEIQLLISNNDQPIPLKPMAQNKFELQDSNNGYYIIFKENKGEATESIQYFQGDFEYKGERIELNDLNHEDIDFDELTGLFYSPELNTVYSFSYDGEALVASHARNLPIKLTPFQEDEFTSSSPFFQKVVFTRNEHQQITGCLVSASRSRNIEFRRLK